MRLFDLEQHSRVELPTQPWKSCVLPLHQCCLKIKNMNFQPLCKGKGPHPIYLFRFDATSVDGEATTLPFSVYKHLSNIHPSRLSLFHSTLFRGTSNLCMAYNASGKHCSLLDSLLLSLSLRLRLASLGLSV